MLNRRIFGFVFYGMFGAVVVFGKLNFCCRRNARIFNNIYFGAALKFKFMAIFNKYLLILLRFNDIFGKIKDSSNRVFVENIFIFVAFNGFNGSFKSSIIIVFFFGNNAQTKMSIRKI
jgi:hypothetical protein